VERGDQMTFCPLHFKVVSGVGRSQYPLVAFDNALRYAGIGDFNLVKVSSVLPANCIYTEDIQLENGSILYAAYSTLTLKECEKGVTAVAVAVPTIVNDSGVIFECSLYDAEIDLENNVQKMCVEAMENRGKYNSKVISSSQKASGEPACFTSSISAVVMW